MGRLQKVSAKDVPQASSVESPDSSKDPFVPNDFADENVMSLNFSADDEDFHKALYNFYVNNMKQFLCVLFMQEVKRCLPFAWVPSMWACDVWFWRSGGCWPLIF
nr:uncharacterized protein LOC109757095 [Aegilops tauschii subsp. strangulata]